MLTAKKQKLATDAAEERAALQIEVKETREALHAVGGDQVDVTQGGKRQRNDGTGGAGGVAGAATKDMDLLL